jgi:hypothetical protein
MGWDRSIPTITEWVAVLGVAGSAEQLDGLAAELLDQVPDHGLFGTVDAHEGLAERLRVPPRDVDQWRGGRDSTRDRPRAGPDRSGRARSDRRVPDVRLSE